jgi:ABC-type Mn2+/Zn2+ transport system permease subunit
MYLNYNLLIGGFILSVLAAILWLVLRKREFYKSNHGPILVFLLFSVGILMMGYWIYSVTQINWTY